MGYTVNTYRRGAIPFPIDTMSLMSKILGYLYRNVRIRVADAYKTLDNIDTDKDGYLSLGEIISAFRRVAE